MSSLITNSYCSFCLQEETSDLEDDDLSNLSDDEAAGPTSNAQHIEDLKALALKDPEFFKYLQENDAELLDFGGEASDEADEDAELSDEESEEDSEDEKATKGDKGKGKEKEVKPTPILTKEILKKWQRSIIEVSLIYFLRRFR